MDSDICHSDVRYLEDHQVMDRDLSRVIIIILFGLAGICMAGISYALYVNGIVVDEMVSGSITIQNVMAIEIIVWLIVGGIIAART